MPDGNCFAAPDQFGATPAKISPAADSGFARFAIARSVPTFHRMNAEAIADRFSGNVHWLRERRIWASFDAIVARHRQTQTFTMRLKLLDAPHPTNRWKLSHHA